MLYCFYCWVTKNTDNYHFLEERINLIKLLQALGKFSIKYGTNQFKEIITFKTLTLKNHQSRFKTRKKKILTLYAQCLKMVIHPLKNLVANVFKVCNIFKVCLTILGHYVLKSYIKTLDLCLIVMLNILKSISQDTRKRLVNVIMVSLYKTFFLT